MAQLITSTGYSVVVQNGQLTTQDADAHIHQVKAVVSGANVNFMSMDLGLNFGSVSVASYPFAATHPLTKPPTPPGPPQGNTWQTVHDSMKTWWTNNQADMRKWQDEFQYQGFSAMDVFKSLNAIAQNPIKTKQDDFAMLVILAVERGANIQNLQKKTSASGKQMINQLISKYGLKSKATDAKSLTLPRISLVLPWLTCSYMEYANNKVVSDALLPVGYPVFMRTAAFANFISPSWDTNTVITLTYAFGLHQVFFGEQINPKDSSEKKVKAANSLKYIEMGMKSPFLTAAARWQHLKDWNIIVAGVGTADTLAPAVMVAANIFKQWLTGP